jgi:hypothetical protein
VTTCSSTGKASLNQFTPGAAGILTGLGWRGNVCESVPGFWCESDCKL